MMKIFYGGQRKANSFNHKPISFSPEQEAKEARLARIKKEMGLMTDDEFKSTIKGEFVKQTTHLRKREDRGGKDSFNWVLKFVLLIVLIVILFYLVPLLTAVLKK